MRTSPFGNSYEPWMDEREESGGTYCECCNELIPDGDTAYYINAKWFCKRCEDAARDEIFDIIGDDYLVEVAE